MSMIERIHARQILDSRGNPTVEVEQRSIHASLIERVEPGDLFGDRTVHVLDGAHHAFAAVARVVAVA